MSYRLLIARPTDLDTVCVLIDAWWDRGSRSWVIQSKNAAGDQIGDSTYVGTRLDAIHDVRTRRAHAPAAKVKWSS